MKEFFQKTWASILGLINLIRIFIVWVFPFLCYIVVVYYIIRRIYGFDLNTFTEILKITVWPATILIALFFFRKVVTYMFFSMNEFNFFGARGELVNVHRFLDDEIDRRLKEEKIISNRELEFKALTSEIKQKNGEIELKSGEAQENLSLATKILRAYSEYKKDAESRILQLEQDLGRLKQVGLQGGIEPTSGDLIPEENQDTSGVPVAGEIINPK